MSNSLRAGMVLLITVVTVAGCVITRPRTSDNKGPDVIVTLTGGAEYRFATTDARQLPRENCAIVRGNIDERNVDVQVIITDQSGMDEARIVTEGNGITPGTPALGETVPDIRLSFNDGNFRDEISVDFLPLGANVRTGAVVMFNIEGTFQAGVTLSAVARDSFGNTTTVEPFRLVSDLAANCANR